MWIILVKNYIIFIINVNGYLRWLNVLFKSQSINLFEFSCISGWHDSQKLISILVLCVLSTVCYPDYIEDIISFYFCLATKVAKKAFTHNFST